MEIDAFTDLVTLAVVVFTHAAHKNECKKRLSQCQCKKKLLTKALRRCQMSLLVFVAATWCSLNLWWDQPRVWPSSVAWCLVFFAFAINLWPCCCCWLLLYSAILHSWADSVHLHVVLHEWIAFYSAFFWISTKAVYLQHWHGWCHMKLLPSQCVLCTPYNHAPCHFMQSHIRKVHVCLAVTCHLQFWQNGLITLHLHVMRQGAPTTASIHFLFSS